MFCFSKVLVNREKTLDLTHVQDAAPVAVTVPQS